MKQHITDKQVSALSTPALAHLQAWWQSGIEHDDDVVSVYIAEEQSSYVGRWDQEYPFDYPFEYIGKLKNHEGTMLPLLMVGDLTRLIDECINVNQWVIERDKMSDLWGVRARSLAFSGQPELVDALWEAARILLENKDSDDE